MLMPLPASSVVVETSRAADFPTGKTVMDGGFSLVVPSDRMVKSDRTPLEEGTVQFFWNEQGLIIEFQLHDSDILAKGDADQLQHNELGDVLEIFLQPPGKPYYWELFVTPRGYQTCLFWNRTVSKEWDKGPERRIRMKVEIASVDSGEFPGWRASVLIPFTDLMRLGDASPQDGGWRILVARQNYTDFVQLDHRELSSFPPLEKTNFHATEHFAELHLKGLNHP